MDFQHKPVLFHEVLRGLNCQPCGTYIDCTLGGAGHSHAIATQLQAAGLLVGIDQDEQAIKAASSRLAGVACTVKLIHSNFRHLLALMRDLQVEAVDGILFDLGVSSYQLDNAERGFSYKHDALLDMRMDRTTTLTAAEIVNHHSLDALQRIIADFGEERWAKRIAQFIVEQRKREAITTTGQLVQVIKDAIPAAARRDGPHPAKRTFQALRIAVNDELGILKQAFTDAVRLLRPGGRLCVITFHSLEDRICKQTFRELAHPCSCPPQLPLCVCGKQPLIHVIGKSVSPGTQELDDNPRARSARLRIAEKC